ncbi:MAG: hypothetical protein HOP23_19105 [Methylococcaceae bacterium]|nr:hypothetical protein [Methylococcaceae bacterium]
MNIKSWQRIQFLPLALLGLMALTRFDHFGSAFSLPDASLAVFFLAGLGINRLWFFTVLLLEAGLIDYLAITQFNVSDYCISPAYGFLIPAYAVLWFTGVFSKRFVSLSIGNTIKMVGLIALATTSAFVISNGSFYLLSDKIVAISLLQFTSQFSHYYPPYLISTLCYGLAALLVTKLIKSLLDTTITRTTT